jgi:hypothetical protein
LSSPTGSSWLTLVPTKTTSLVNLSKGVETFAAWA